MCVFLCPMCHSHGQAQVCESSYGFAWICLSCGMNFSQVRQTEV